ncbi:hypothetical protein GCM10009133_05440 [Cocleimonas flava]
MIDAEANNRTKDTVLLFRLNCDKENALIALINNNAIIKMIFLLGRVFFVLMYVSVKFIFL